MRVGEWGHTLYFNLHEDISSATTLLIKVSKNGAATIDWTATAATAGATTFIKYTTVSGDINVKGKYSLLPYALAPTGGAVTPFELYADDYVYLNVEAAP